MHLRARLPINFLYKLITPLIGQKLHNIDGKITNIIAIDCEMCGIGKNGNKSILSRISIVNYYGKVIYDKFVKPQNNEIITDYRTKITGITENDIKNGINYIQCCKEVFNIMKNKIIVGHDLRNDFNVLGFKEKLGKCYANKIIESKKNKLNAKQLKRIYNSYINGINKDEWIFDTAKCILLNERLDKPRSLKFMVELYLGINIQGDIHDSVQDAIATMALYRAILPEINKYKKEIKQEIFNKIEDNNKKEKMKIEKEKEKMIKKELNVNKYKFDKNYAYSSNILNNLHLIKTWGVDDGKIDEKNDKNENNIDLKTNPYKNAIFKIDVNQFLNE